MCLIADEYDSYKELEWRPRGPRTAKTHPVHGETSAGGEWFYEMRVSSSLHVTLHVN